MDLLRQQAVDEAVRESARVVADLAGRQPGPGPINDVLPDLRSLADGIHYLPEQARFGRELQMVASIHATTRWLRVLESDRGNRLGPTCVLCPRGAIVLNLHGLLPSRTTSSRRL